MVKGEKGRGRRGGMGSRGGGMGREVKERGGGREGKERKGRVGKGREGREKGGKEGKGREGRRMGRGGRGRRMDVEEVGREHIGQNVGYNLSRTLNLIGLQFNSGYWRTTCTILMWYSNLHIG